MVAESKQLGSKIPTVLQQRRSQLQKQAASLRECLVNYKFSSPAGVPLECRTTWFVRKKQQGINFTQPFSPGTAQLTTANALRIREQSSTYIYVAHTFGMERTWLSLYFFVILPSSYDLEIVTSCSVSQGVRRIPNTPWSIRPCFLPMVIAHIFAWMELFFCHDYTA